MRGLSSVASVTVHLAVGAALLFGPPKTGQPDPAPPRVPQIVFPPSQREDRAGSLTGDPFPGPITVAAPDIGQIPIPSIPQTRAIMKSLSPDFSPFSVTGGTGQQSGWSALVTEQGAEILSGPLPAYPELLRQGGVQGRVVLEAVVDTTGRVVPSSILVVSTTNTGFVAPARQALLGTLFRPAMVGGRAVQLRVRIPYDFSIRRAR